MDPRNTTSRKNPIGEDYWADDKNDWEDEEAYAKEDEEDEDRWESEDYYEEGYSYQNEEDLLTPKPKEQDSDIVYDDSIGYTSLFHHE